MKIGDLVQHDHKDTFGIIIGREWSGDWLVLFGDGRKMWVSPRYMKVINESR